MYGTVLPWTFTDAFVTNWNFWTETNTPSRISCRSCGTLSVTL
jgi:hypothetical protein